MLVQIAFFALVTAGQYALVFGASYVAYRYRRTPADLRGWRDMVRFFAAFAILLVLIVLLVRQAIVRDSWLEPFAAPIWIGGVFVAHDLALNLAIRNRNGQT